MKKLVSIGLTAIVAIGTAGAARSVQAQISVNVQIGSAPVCPYGYYGYAPYNCAPFGYYGPQWFSTGVFVGAGPWFAGPVGFRGWVDRHYDPHFGYRGPFPLRGGRPDWDRHRGWERRFHGDYEASEYRRDNGNHYGQYKDHHDNGNHYGEYKEHGNPHDRGDGDHHDHGNGNGHGHDD